MKRAPFVAAWISGSWIATQSLGCALDSRNPREAEMERAGNEPAPSASGNDSQSNSAGERRTEPSGAAGSGSGSSAERPVGQGAAGASAQVSAADCDDAPLLPDQIGEDLTVSGCVRVQRTEVHSGATLTLQPGTTVLMEAGGLLNVSPLSDVGSHLVAKGTAEQPILFTSAAADPLPGDWQCVSIGERGSNSELEHVTLEYGGAACASTGAGATTILQVDAAVRAIREVTVRESSAYGVMLFRSAAVRDFSNNHFARNAQASIYIDGSQIFQLGAGNTFDDADDFIEVVEGSGINANGTWRKQSVPFRVQNLGISPGFDVTVEAGVHFQMAGTIDAFNANFDLEGTQSDPIVFTSAKANPQPGDWGCLLYSYSDVTPRINYTIFEYAGSGSGCLGSSTKAALIAPNSSNITNTVFRYIDGVGISTRGDCNVADWCQNEFTEVAQGAFLCESTYTACP